MNTEALDQFVENLKKHAGENLRSVLLYGMPCRRPESFRPEEMETLILVKALKSEQMDALQPAIRQWVSKRHPMPKLFTYERFLQSTDIFPIECMEVLNFHKVLYGEEVTSQMEVSQSNLRLQLETEFKGKLLQLREGYLASSGNAGSLAKVMDYSLVSMESMLRALHHWMGGDPRSEFDELIGEMQTKVGSDLSIIRSIEAMRAEQKKPGKAEMKDLFDRYLTTLEVLSDYIDQNQSSTSSESASAS